jgi:hypothetical protein
MVSYTPLREETLADQRLYLEGRMAEVVCGECSATVLVRKHSEFHTSIQWSAEAVARCAVFASTQQGGPREVHESCPRLKESIEHAVKTGRLSLGGGVDPVPDPDGGTRG